MMDGISYANVRNFNFEPSFHLLNYIGNVKTMQQLIGGFFKKTKHSIKPLPTFIGKEKKLNVEWQIFLPTVVNGLNN